MASIFSGLNFGGGFFNDIAGAASDILGGQQSSDQIKAQFHAQAAGDRIKAVGFDSEAEDYTMASSLAKQNEQITGISTQMQSAAQQRNFEKVQGGTISQIAGANLSGGSAADILRENAQQGAIANAAINAQGQITEAGYATQAGTYKDMSSLATQEALMERQAATQADSDAETIGNEASSNGWIGGAIKGAIGIASLFL